MRLSRLMRLEWELCERVCRAALDCGDSTTADRLLNDLARKFPSSTRVLILGAMNHESRREWKRADDIYCKILEEDPTHMVCVCVCVCVCVF